MDSKLGNHPSLNSDGQSSFQQILSHLLHVNVQRSQIFFPSNLVAFSTKKTAEILEFFFFVDANSASFSFFWKINLPNFLLQNIEKRNPATRREQTNVSIYFKLLILWPLGCMGAIMQREMAIAGMERLGS